MNYLIKVLFAVDETITAVERIRKFIAILFIVVVLIASLITLYILN
jgi:hypothetical protein